MIMQPNPDIVSIIGIKAMANQSHQLKIFR